MEQRQEIKIVIVSPSLNVGGIEKALTTLANEFVKSDVTVVFISCLPGEMHYNLDDKVRLLPSQIPYTRGTLGKLKFYTKLILFLRKVINKENPTVVLSFGDAFNPLVLFSLIGTGHKVYISDRTSPSFKLNPIIQFLKRILYPLSSGFIAQTKRVKDFQIKRFGGRLNIRVIPNAIDLIPRNPIGKRMKSILYVGRLSEEKGVDRLIKAFSLINDKNWVLNIVGNGPLGSKLKVLSTTLQCENRVNFHGLIANPNPFYRKASIFVLPSHVEGFPNALCEAMSVGLATICFDSIPYEDIFIPEFSGLVVPKDDVKQLSVVIERLIVDKTFRSLIGKNAELTIKQFSKDIIAGDYLEFMNLE